MRRIIILIFSLAVMSLQAQLINVNPNKDAEPWMAGGFRIPTAEELAAIPVFVPPINRQIAADELPQVWDNSQNSYFRPVFNQQDGSCSQASGVGYTFTYEMNRLRNTSASSQNHQYPSHYTYNFLNDGSGDNGSFYTDGWNIIQDGGCPTVSEYGGMAISDKYWMSGYDKYEQSMQVGIEDYFAMQVGTPEGLTQLKQWLYDHFDGGDTGGIVNFAAGVTGTFNMTWDNKITHWGDDVNHAMTIVGWDDNVPYDYNNDGQITNDIDINNDGIVDMRDWEKGALIMVNTWGTYFGDSGKAYIMYKTLAESVGGGGIYNHEVYGIHVKDNITPDLILRVKLKHDKRSRIKVFAGYSDVLTAETPNHVALRHHFSFQGGEYPLNGTSNVPFELSINVSEFYEEMLNAGEVRFFLIVKELDSGGEAEGEILDFSLVDKEGNVYECPDHNMPVENNKVNFYPLDISLNPTGLPSNQKVDFKVYPNPVKDVLIIDFQEDIIWMRIRDITGRELMSGQTKSVNVSTLPAGLYFMEISDQAGIRAIRRFIKK